jgi:uncharacterized membrane protein YhaH (DUF805 family)
MTSTDSHSLSSHPAESFWSPKSRISRSTYCLRILILLAGAVAVVLLFGRGKSLFGGIAFLVVLLAIALQVIKRSRDGLGSGWWALLLCIPPVAGMLMLVLAFKGTAETSADSNLA